MADYNSLGLAQAVGTRLALRTGMVERIATNGAVRPRALYAAPKYDPIVVHQFMTDTQRQSLVDFYMANRLTTFTFTANEDGVRRTCTFAATPYEMAPMNEMPFLYQATVYLREA